MGLLLCLAAAFVVALLAKRSLGHSLGLVLAIGCAYGLVRANVYDGFVHFLFDSAVLGLYIGSWGTLLEDPDGRLARIKNWIVTLCVLPFVLILVSPFLDSQPLLVQLAGLRPAMFFVPVLLVGTKLQRSELEQLGSWATGAVIATALVAAAEFKWGLEPFLPLNSATELIYHSSDVGEEMLHRIPSTFVSAHSYGGTMVVLLPLLVLGLERGGTRRVMAILSLLCAGLGVFASAARSPVVGLAIVGVGLAMSRRTTRSVRFAVVSVACALALIVPMQARLQRFETLADTGYVGERVRGSVNMGFFEAAFKHPLGMGLASAVGTSIPYFLEESARPQYGIENEYARLVLEEGIPGAILWVAFVLWILIIDPRRYDQFGGTFELGAWTCCVMGWIQALIGTGLLASVPATVLLLLYMGILARQRADKVSERSMPSWRQALPSRRVRVDA
jgi:O-Antigen ligase